MLGLRLISCIIIFISCVIFQASLLPLKHNTIISSINKNINYEDFKSYYYPSTRQRSNEVHDSIDDNEDSIITKTEMMEPSASNYYSSQQQKQHQNEEDEYSDYTSDAMSPENFESSKIKSNDGSSINNNKLNVTSNLMILSINDNMPNITHLPQQQMPQIEMNSNSSSKFSKLLFSSPSATVTSNGPSGPFKAIICHDCENSGGVNVGHSVSFSAIKSWNVGSSSSSNAAQRSSLNESLVKQNHQDLNMSGAVEHTSENYFDAVINSNNNKDSDLSINQNVPIENQGNVYKAETITVNDSGQQQQQPSLSKDWNYSLLSLSVRNENIKVNNPIILSTTTEATKKPIFNDLLKVPYDILNQPLTEAPPTSSIPSSLSSSSSSTGGGAVAAVEGRDAAIKQTQIHINHQQKFNDTITNYQHFQQFIQKSPTANNNAATGHYQSTPMPEQNYEVDESVSVMTNGRAHGVVQLTTPKVNSHVVVNEEKNENHHNIPLSQQQQQQPSPSPLHVTHHDQDAKFGVVFEGRDFRKYKVEEKTADGFIVGEYGYLSNTDGSPIFGVRYTADSNINPQLIYDALLKFLKL